MRKADRHKSIFIDLVDFIHTERILYNEKIAGFIQSRSQGEMY